MSNPFAVPFTIDPGSWDDAFNEFRKNPPCYEDIMALIMTMMSVGAESDYVKTALLVAREMRAKDQADAEAIAAIRKDLS